MRAGILGLAMLTGLSGGAAHADMRTLSQSGYWEVIGGTPVNSTMPMCGISTKFPTMGGMFLVKWLNGSVFIQIFKTSWNISQGMQSDVAIQFDQLSPWTGKASGIATSNNVGGLELAVPVDRLPQFLQELRFAARMVVSFPTGTEKPWVASMTGSNTAAMAMVQCVSVAALGQPVQPQSPSQPYAVKPPVAVAPTSPRPAAAPLRDGYEAL